MENNKPQKEKEINDYVLKISGNSSLPSPLRDDKNYTFMIKGEYDSEKKKDLKDGTIDIIYNFKQLEAAVVDEKQNIIFSKDKRSMSQKMRGRICVYQKDKGILMEEEAFYRMSMGKIITYFDLVMEFLKNKS